MHVVVFPGWYPARGDKLSGDFIQRHMHAISLTCRVTVIIPIKEKGIKKAERIENNDGNLNEISHYYPSITSISCLDNLISFLRYNWFCLSETRKILKKEGIDLVQLYVLQKNFIIGFLLKYLYNIPYVISEQSTLYIDGRFEKLNPVQKKLFKLVFAGAISYHAVSKYLAKNIREKLCLQKEAVIIPNVVDTTLFFPKKKSTGGTITLVHVSNMVAQKNVEGMLRAFKEVERKKREFLLNLVGPLPLSIEALVDHLGLRQNVVTYGARTYREVADIIQRSDVFVFFTRFETFGCVIIEANACGLPVIVSDLEVTKELIENEINGVFARSEDEMDLAEKILFTIDNFNKFNCHAIALKAREEFNYEHVSKQFYNWYSAILNRQSPG